MCACVWIPSRWWWWLKLLDHYYIGIIILGAHNNFIKYKNILRKVINICMRAIVQRKRIKKMYRNHESWLKTNTKGNNRKVFRISLSEMRLHQRSSLIREEFYLTGSSPCRVVDATINLRLHDYQDNFWEVHKKAEKYVFFLFHQR